jgi:hypothetical protein
MGVNFETRHADVEGSFCTDIGNTLAKYHSFEPTELGSAMFSAWIDEIDRAKFTVKDEWC